MDIEKKIFYVFDKKLLEASNKMTNIRNRAIVVNSLIASYNLFPKLEIIQGEIASDEDLISFHCREYLNYLKKTQNSSNLEVLSHIDNGEDFNIGYDCPLFENMYDFVKIIAGSSLSAAKKLVPENINNDKVEISSCSQLKNTLPRSYLKFKYKLLTENNKSSPSCELPMNWSFEENISSDAEITEKEKDFEQISCSTLNCNKGSNEAEIKKNDIHHIAINWFGGWHHAQRDQAEGFCYVNDIVIAIMYLLKTYKRILYIDLDIHHGNGVENAFAFSPRVFVLSIHKYETGYYPGSGSLNDIGHGNGRFYTANVPLKDGVTDEVYVRIFTTIVRKIFANYKPECIVMQCGADSITGDPLGGFNLTPVAIGNCLRLVLNEKLPTLILGGGGYNIPNVAKCWTYLTGVILDCSLSNDIPDNSFFHLFGPGFELSVTPTLRRNENSEIYLEKIVSKILQYLDSLEI